MESAVVPLGLSAVASVLSQVCGTVGTCSLGQQPRWAPSAHSSRGMGDPRAEPGGERRRPRWRELSAQRRGRSLPAGRAFRPLPRAPVLCPVRSLSPSGLHVSGLGACPASGDLRSLARETRDQAACGSASRREKNYTPGAIKPVRKPCPSSEPTRLVRPRVPELGTSRRRLVSSHSRVTTWLRSPRWRTVRSPGVRHAGISGQNSCTRRPHQLPACHPGPKCRAQLCPQTSQSLGPSSS